MIEGKTPSGFNFALADDILDDFELFEVFCEIDKGKVEYIPEAAKKLLGEKQYTELKTFLRNNGRVSTKVMTSEVMAILSECKQTKNC